MAYRLYRPKFTVNLTDLAIKVFHFVGRVQTTNYQVYPRLPANKYLGRPYCRAEM